MVRAHPFCVYARIAERSLDTENKIIGERTERLETLGCIPFESIIAYDVDGDEYYNYPHLYCDFINGTDPYEEIQYKADNGLFIAKDDIIEIL